MGCQPTVQQTQLAYMPFYASWLNRTEAPLTALRYFALDGTDHESHPPFGREARTPRT